MVPRRKLLRFFMTECWVSIFLYCGGGRVLKANTEFSDSNSNREYGIRLFRRRKVCSTWLFWLITGGGRRAAGADPRLTVLSAAGLSSVSLHLSLSPHRQPACSCQTLIGQMSVLTRNTLWHSQHCHQLGSKYNTTPYQSSEKKCLSDVPSDGAPSLLTLVCIWQVILIIDIAVSLIMFLTSSSCLPPRHLQKSHPSSSRILQLWW